MSQKETILEGNQTKINPKQKIIGRFCTNAITQKDYQKDQVGHPDLENVLQAKREVDDNHK